MTLIHVLVTKDEERYHAHALEFDLMAVGDTVGESIDHLQDQIRFYIETCAELGIPFEEMKRPAPQEFYGQFEATFVDPKSAVFVGTLSLGEYLGGPREEAVAVM